jgi:hypothetical protein
LAAANPQTLDQGSKTLLVVALSWRQQEGERTTFAVNPHVQLGGEATAAAA